MDFNLCVSCSTFNHEGYIKDAMEGFCMQQTKYPYVCIIYEDKSTDGTRKVIEQYLAEYFEPAQCETPLDTDDYLLRFMQHRGNQNCHFAVFLLKYNHYQIKKDRTQYAKEFIQLTPYVAVCQGDDYWTDPNKLQIQVDFLETHPDYSMCCCRAKMYSLTNKNFRKKDNFCRKNNGILSPKEIIRRGGFYIPSCSIIYRKEILDSNYPEYCKKSPVGDYPLQIYLAMKGKVYYYDTPMAVYRVDNPTAWTGKAISKKDFSQKDLEGFRHQLEMLYGFAHDYPVYADACMGKVEFYINSKFRSNRIEDPANQKILNFFKDDIKNFSLRGRIDKRMRLCRFRILQSLYFRTLFKWMFRNYLDLF